VRATEVIEVNGLGYGSTHLINVSEAFALEPVGIPFLLRTLPIRLERRLLMSPVGFKILGGDR